MKRNYKQIRWLFLQINWTNLNIINLLSTQKILAFKWIGVVVIKKFDKEYQTNWIAEQLYLSNCGIRYEFVKNINGITTYKYRKTAKLFECLANFYKNHGIIE